jgi:hypothetical protein
VAIVHHLVTGWTPPKTERNLYQFCLYIGGGNARTNYSISGGQNDLYSFNGPITEIGMKAVYGNPFEQNEKVPYRHFELDVSLGINFWSYNSIRILSDGYLFSFSPISTATSAMSTGLSMQYDFVTLGELSIYDGTIDQYSGALDWTIKYRRLLQQNTDMQIKLHTGFTYLGVSEYHSPEKKDPELKNYGYGFNTKLFNIFDFNKNASLEISNLFYVLWSYPGTSELSKGTVYWHFADITYQQHIFDNISIGVTFANAIERGFFGNYPDTKKQNREIKLFAALNL